jgi:hypothetical protein
MNSFCMGAIAPLIVIVCLVFVGGVYAQELNWTMLDQPDQVREGLVFDLTPQVAKPNAFFVSQIAYSAEEAEGIRQDTYQRGNDQYVAVQEQSFSTAPEPATRQPIKPVIAPQAPPAAPPERQAVKSPVQAPTQAAMWAHGPAFPAPWYMGQGYAGQRVWYASHGGTSQPATRGQARRARRAERGGIFGGGLFGGRFRGGC